MKNKDIGQYYVASNWELEIRDNNSSYNSEEGAIAYAKEEVANCNVPVEKYICKVIKVVRHETPVKIPTVVEDFKSEVSCDAAEVSV